MEVLQEFYVHYILLYNTHHNPNAPATIGDNVTHDIANCCFDSTINCDSPFAQVHPATC